MKKALFLVFMSTVFLLVGCRDSLNEGASSDIIYTSAEVSTVMPSLVIANDEYKNEGRMADADGPSVCVYSKKGFNRASLTVDMARSTISLKRKDDGRFVNAYIFLGIDIYDSAGNWMNCLDAGLCRSGNGGGWHIFYNLYEAPDGESTWYESSKPLKGPVYTIVLDSSSADEKASVTVLDGNGDVADTASFSALGAKADGSNTAYLQDFALDFPPNLIIDENGDSTDDFTKVIRANTDFGLCMRGVTVTDAKLFENGEELIWTEEHTSDFGIWPDSTQSLGYRAVSVAIFDKYSSFAVDLNMNRK